MDQTRLDRINELARLSRQRELSDIEKKEQKVLRDEYIAEWKRGTEATLNQIVIVEPDGTKHPIKKK